MLGMKKYLILLLVLVNVSVAQAQRFDSLSSASPEADSSGIVEGTLLPTTAPILLFDDEKRKEEKKKKRKKRKKNIYYGERTRKDFIRVDARGKTQYQLFHYTARNRQVNPYVRDVYWLDTKDNVIRTKGFDPEKGYLLHGPYERRIDDAVVEKGMFYFGTKHERWMTFDQKNILLNKANYYEGWPKDSRVTYYNKGEQQIEKVIPVEYDLKEGNFYHFYENGQLAVMGEYHYGEKVGLWTEYWNTDGGKTIRKREIQYQEEPFTRNFRPYIKAEWNADGQLIYQAGR
ncbi:toxin-antitoxin system YwqK family antitoxin [Echinicola vietnamensis]|uniref:MORN repeat protein n=1 Tax=Echinicola vietnamensis (strain DSM 17526 / LMG 23754 / KMM 6221) TaxID=926556 RepID=L0FW16_ECHVK|nr:hypothetical protein Echvi_0674 [Echinicola vietnamensis DSM 17526]